MVRSVVDFGWGWFGRVNGVLGPPGFCRSKGDVFALVDELKTQGGKGAYNPAVGGINGELRHGPQR